MRNWYRLWIEIRVLEAELKRERGVKGFVVIGR